MPSGYPQIGGASADDREATTHVEGMNLERTTLERKDRTELATIAEALGRKPGSRAKKSEIVDMILELAGVVESGSAASADADGPSAASGDGPDAPEPASAATDDAPADTADGPAEVAAESAEGDEQDAPAESERPARGDASRKGGEPGRDVAAASDDANGEGGQSDGENWEAEPGNRRRRRRRGRDRQGEGGQSEGEAAIEGELTEVAGLLDLRDEGYGFLRVKGFLPSRDDVYVSVKQVRQFGLRRGDHLTGAARPAGRQEKNPALLRIDLVNGKEPDAARGRPKFDQLTPLFPDERLLLAGHDPSGEMTGRIIDLISPIGKGQRGLIVSPPKAGKTTIMKTIASAIEANNPEVHLIVLLVDERPEEVTDIRRSVKGEVVASTFDRPAEEHTAVAELTIEHAKRLVEYGEDVVIILDGITRLARAYNLSAPANGRIMSGGLDTGALYPPKRFFGAARNTEEGGSLTILATALIDTGSKMDEVIFEEFKGTGNMELRLDRRLAEKRVYPAIDVDASSTRREDLLFDPKQLQNVWKLRRVLSGLASEGSDAATLELLIDRMRTFPTNEAFLAELGKSQKS